VADQTSALMAAGFITTMCGIGILGARWIIKDALYKEYCVCDHEYNEHYIVPRGMINPMETEKCKRCGCRSYNKNPKQP
jgi:hypothetical protein